MDWHATTILSVRKGGKVAIGGDGQVTLGTQVMKADAVKIRKLLEGQVLVGFAGSAADGFALLERFEGKLKDYPNNVPRAATELAKLWRTDRMLRRLEAVLLVVGCAAQPAGDRLGRRDPAQRRHPGDRLGRRLRPGGRPGADQAHRALGRGDRPRVAGDRRRHRHLHELQLDGGGTAVPEHQPERVDPPADRRRAGPRHRRPGRRQAGRGDRPAQPLAAAAAAGRAPRRRSRPRTSC